MPSTLNSDNGVSSGTSGLKSTGGNDGILTFQSSGTETMRIDASGNVGIGTTSPTQPLSIARGASVAAYMDLAGGGRTLGTTSLTIGQASDGVSTIFQRENAALYFATNSTERMRLDSSGNLGIGTSSPTATFGSNVLQLYGSAATEMRFTSGNTGTGGSDGLSIGIDSSSIAYVYNRENTALVFGTNNTERARITSGGDFLVGTTSNGFVNGWSASLRANSVGDVLINHPNTSGSGQAYAQFGYNGGSIGSITQNGTTAVAYNTSSDYRLKENIQPMQNALAKIARLKPCTYTWKSDGADGEGFIAHELAEICPGAVTGEKDAVNEDGSIRPQGIDTSFLVATLTAAIQELNAKVEAQAAEIAALKAKV